MLDILIENGSYPCFDTGKLRRANIGIAEEKIAYLGDQTPDAKQRIDAAGKIVSPGFIDIHMHEENFAEKRGYFIAELMLRMGVTTALGGNCGIIRQSVRAFRDTIDDLGGAPINYAMLTGYNHYRSNVLGYGHYDAAPREAWDRIAALMREDIDNGACGISFGMEYDPGITEEEMVYAAKAFDDRHILISCHAREAGAGAFASLDEVFRMQRECKNRVQLSHLGSLTAFGQMREGLEQINRFIEQDPRFSYDIYPYDAFCTLIGSEGFGPDFKRIYNKEDYSCVMLTGEPYRGVFCTDEIFERARKEYPNMLAVCFVMNEAEISMALANRYGMIASDGIIESGVGHPRAAGTFPRVLGKYVREENCLSLIDALRKMTLEPAKRLEIEDRKGAVRVGMDADLTVFDPDTVRDGATYESLQPPPVGIDCVIVNGQIACMDNEIRTRSAGRFIAAQGSQR